MMIPKIRYPDPTPLLPRPHYLRQKKEAEIIGAYQDMSRRLTSNLDISLGDRQQAVLKLKLARHFQAHDTIDLNTLYDALIETPKFLEKDKGSLGRLFEIHEQKTLQKIAEMRKRKAEQTGL